MLLHTGHIQHTQYQCSAVITYALKQRTHGGQRLKHDQWCIVGLDNLAVSKCDGQRCNNAQHNAVISSHSINRVQGEAATVRITTRQS